MPPTRVLVYRDSKGRSPLKEWLEEVRKRDRIAYGKCLARILLLRQLGNELKEPYSKYLEEGVYELRAKKGTVNYRILYFFAVKTQPAFRTDLRKKTRRLKAR